MSIYTRTGDEGMTSLYGGSRVAKTNKHIEACGSIDELSSFIGVVLRETTNKKEVAFLTSIQRDLYDVMAVLSGAGNVDVSSLSGQITIFEKYIDRLESSLPKLSRFILPQGTRLSVWYHVVRTVCRRAERYTSALKKGRSTIPQESLSVCIAYLNRLSDLFFILARYSNRGTEIVVS